MTTVELLTRHLLVLCCNGGTPYVDLHLWPHGDDQFQYLDPTDWSAEDLPGSELNSTVHPEFLRTHPSLAAQVPGGISLARCDLFNLTFSNPDYQKAFDVANGTLACKCPHGYWGSACHLNTPLALAQVQSLDGLGASTPVVGVLAVAACLAMLVAVSVVVRGCLCDCFGGFGAGGPDRETGAAETDRDAPLDMDAVARNLAAAKRYQAKRYGEEEEGTELQPMGRSILPAYPQAVNMQQHSEQHAPLLQTVSQGCAPVDYPNVAPAPHRSPEHRPLISQDNQAEPDQQHHHHNHQHDGHHSCCRGSPPPSYRSENGSLAGEAEGSRNFNSHGH